MRSTLLRALALAILSMLLVTSVAGAAAVSPTATTAYDTFQDVPVRGTTSAGGVFRGTVDITNFRSTGSGIRAIGKLSGRVLDDSGDLVGRITDQRVSFPVQIHGSAPITAATPAGSSCEILDLRLGPVDLDLRGLGVHLERVVLLISAAPGPGNLLGNLLCAIAGLLDAGGPLNLVLAQLLNVVRQLVNIFG